MSHYLSSIKYHLPSIESFCIDSSGIKAICLVNYNSGFQYGVQVIDVNNKIVEKELSHTASYHTSPPAVLSNDSIVAWQSGSGIKFLDLGSENYWTLTNVSDYLNSISISPDGTEILYSIRNGSNSISPAAEIWAMSIDGNNRTFITNGTDPSFSPDGTKIVYSADEDGDGYYDIWMMDKPPLDIDGNGIAIGDWLILIIVITMAMVITYTVYRRRKGDDKSD